MSENAYTRTLRVLLVGGPRKALADVVERRLADDGFHVERVDPKRSTNETAALDAIVHLPDLVSTVTPDADPAGDLAELVTTNLHRLRARQDGGARIVTVTSRDWLGSPHRPMAAARAAALVAMARSLALTHGSRGITVNSVVVLPGEDLVEGSEPKALLPQNVTDADIARAVTFFVDPRSNYITGQTLHCTGGASLLSSMSV